MKPKILSKTVIKTEQWDDKTKIVFPCECSVTWATTKKDTEIIEHQLCHHHGDLVHNIMSQSVND